ncbi:MAG: hypothetical protein CMJ42_23000 [Phyllobacteriaceae bacterium]|nr:hypothetical protein [Phyllobacteriaceae bacterium]
MIMLASILSLFFSALTVTCIVVAGRALMRRGATAEDRMSASLLVVFSLLGFVGFGLLAILFAVIGGLSWAS